MTSTIARFCAALWMLVITSLVLAGCNKAEKPTPVSASDAGNLQSAGGRKPSTGAAGGGGIPDMNDYPAPSGVKTGVMPGGRK